jgi:protein-tyrosine sulfotransferase
MKVSVVMDAGQTVSGLALPSCRSTPAEPSPLRHLGGFIRFGQSGQLLRRLFGLPDLTPTDFHFSLPAEEVARLAAIARRVRGADHRPAVFVNGVLPRSGTNFIANALALHPTIAAFPRQIFEFPLLEIAPGARALRHEWLAHYPANEAIVHRHELFAYLAAGWLADLQADAPDRHLLFKSPHVRQLSLFRAAFPEDRLVLCLRDGRDVVASTLASFQKRRLTGKSFRQLVHEWRLATEAVLACAPGGPHGHRHTIVVRFEDMVTDHAAEMRRILAAAGLDAAVYPFDHLAQLPVFGSSSAKPSGQWQWQRSKRDATFNPVGRFENWPEARKRAFHHLAGDTLRRAGYC